MSTHLDEALDLLLRPPLPLSRLWPRRIGPLAWGAPTSADLAAVLLLVDWALVQAHRAPVCAPVWRRSWQGLPCAPDNVRDFADRLDARSGLIAAPVWAITGSLDRPSKQTVRAVARRCGRYRSREQFFSAWTKSTPILSTPPTPGAIVDLIHIAHLAQAQRAS